MKTQEEIRTILVAEIIRLKINQAVFLKVITLIIISLIVLVTFCSPNKVLITAGDIVRGIVVVLTVGMVSWWVFSAYYRRKFRDYRPPSEELLQFGKEKLFHIYSSLVNVVGEKEQSLLTEKKEEIKNFLLEFSDFDEEEQYEVRQFIWLLDNKIWKCR